MLAKRFHTIGKSAPGLFRHDVAISRSEYVTVYAETYQEALGKAAPYFMGV